MQSEVVLVVTSPFYKYFVVIGLTLAILGEKFSRIKVVLCFVGTQLLHKRNESI